MKKSSKILIIIGSTIVAFCLFGSIFIKYISPISPTPNKISNVDTIPELFNIRIGDDIQSVRNKIKCSFEDNEEQINSVYEKDGMKSADNGLLFSKGKIFKWAYGMRITDFTCSFKQNKLSEVYLSFVPNRSNYEKLVEIYSKIYGETDIKEENYIWWVSTNPSRQVRVVFDEIENDLYVMYYGY